MKKVVFFSLFFLLAISQSRGQSQLVVNGDFSVNNYAWAQSGYLYYNSTLGYAQLANSSGFPDNYLSGYISQYYYIPTNTNNIDCNFDRYITTFETSTSTKYDSLYISLSDGSNTYFWSLSNLNADSTWKSFSGTFRHNLNNYLINLLGKNVTFQILGITDGSLPTLFRIDNVELWVEPIPNDECSDAIEIFSHEACIPGNFSTLGASQSFSGCTGYADDDVWFKFIATGSEHTITVNSGPGFDAVLDIRSGVCPGNTITNGCVDVTGSEGVEIVNLTGLIPGDTYFIRVFNYGIGCGGADFDICLTSPEKQYCTGTSYLTNCVGTIDDGSAANSYSNNADCSWLIQPTGATSITLKFTQFETESKFDSVTVYDGASTSSAILGHYSGNTLPALISSSTGSLLVTFSSDNSVTKSGWSANYSCTASSIINQYSVYNQLPFPAGTSTNAFLLASGNTSTSASTIKICADGSQATKIQFTNNTSISSQNIKFWIASDPYGDNTDLTGYFINYKIVGNVISAEYTHPKFLPATSGLCRNEIVRIVDFTNPDINVFAIPIQIYRAPLLFVHGLYGDASTFEMMENTLCDESLYTYELCDKANYRFSSLFGFEVNKKIIPEAIDQLLLKCRNNKFSAGKIDLISHSMGGILSRMYLQGNYNVTYRYDINRIITLNTPHSGSQLANLALNDAAVLSCLTLGYLADIYLVFGPNSIADLAVNSNAIDDELNGPKLNLNIVPSSTISTDEDANTTGTACTCLATLLSIQSLNFSTFSLFNELSDLVVANSSQNAGFFSNNNFHTSNQCHLGSTDNPFNISRCKQLLCEGPKSAYFSQDGFHPVNLSYPNKENETDNNSLVVNGNVTITSPQNGTTFHPGDVVSINITGSSNIAKLTVGVGNNSIPLYADFQMSNSGSFLYTIPNVAFGGIKIIAVGIDNGGNFVDLDTLGIQVNTLATLDSLSIYPGLIFAPINGQFKFSLYGYYSDGIKRDLSYLPTLQSYIANNNIASFLNPCIIKGLKVDSTELQITFSGKSIQVPIIVYKGDDAFSIPDPISQNQTDNSAIKIFPNPSSGIFKIEYNTKVGQVITTSIYNQFGQKIYCQKEKVFTDLFLKEINLNTIPAGIYNITIATESKQSSNKFVIIK